MEGTRDARLRMSAGEAKLVPPNFSHQVSFSRRQFSLARIFFFSTSTNVEGLNVITFCPKCNKLSSYQLQ